MLALAALVLLAAARPSSAADACRIGAAEDCPHGSVCMLAKDDKACEPVPAAAPLADLGLPFQVDVEAVCTHSSGEGSHSSVNAFYALDLATPYDQPAALVLAAAGGKAFVFGAKDGSPCSLPPGKPARAETDHCGDSWGNRVKILHDGGYFSYYVHLETALVKTGDMVKKGQPIGVEGWTGEAGHRHLHWSVQKLPGGSVAEWENRIAWVGESVPFQFRAILDGVPRTVDAAALRCAHAGIGSAPREDQPHLRAIGSSH